MDGLYTKNSEVVLYGHPDKLCDGIAETITMSIFNLDGIKARSACEILYSGHNMVIGGEFKTSLSNQDFKTLIEWIVKTIIAKQTNEKINIVHIWQKQSDEIFTASLTGLGDNTIAYGYYNATTNSNMTKNHLYLNKIIDKITNIHQKELPDGKLILLNDYLTISVEEGITLDQLKTIDQKIKNPKFFKKSGALADSGVVGRKLVAERHGNGIPHGGGAFTGKDFTKGDKSLKLIGDALAEKKGKELKKDILLQVSCEYGGDKIWIYDYETQKTNYESFTNFIDKYSLGTLYQKYSPIKPSNFLNTKNINDLETLILKLANKKELKYYIW